mmetsp:Transcript_114298/g.323187  ORF Transcript_114298/g.323187 Transcript_114298/m.323187 type:complete len:148 (-) Transcript_114298:7-450(-)
MSSGTADRRMAARRPSGRSHRPLPAQALMAALHAHKSGTRPPRCADATRFKASPQRRNRPQALMSDTWTLFCIPPGTMQRPPKRVGWIPARALPQARRHRNRQERSAGGNVQKGRAFRSHPQSHQRSQACCCRRVPQAGSFDALNGT